MAVVGNLSLDRIDGGPPRIGGGAYHAARGLRLLGTQAVVLTRCSDGDRRLLRPQLARLGLPVQLLAAERTAAFELDYTGESRTMTVDAIGHSWTPRDARALDRRIRWVHVAPLLRSDFPAETVAELARGRRVLFDAQGLVRRAELGPLRLDADFDPGVLRHVSILKVADEEARVIGDVHALGVPEVVVTHGSQGSTVHANGRETFVRAFPLPRDPTGAGDVFSAAYVVARSAGYSPTASARRATAVVGATMR